MSRSTLLLLVLALLGVSCSLYTSGALTPSDQFFTGQFDFPMDVSLAGSEKIEKQFTVTLPVIEPFRVSSVYDPLTVLFTASFVNHIEDLQVTLSKDGVSVTLIQFDGECAGQFGEGGAQLLFNDDAKSIRKDMWSCNPTSSEGIVNNNIPLFQSGQAYALQPFSPLAKFDNMAIGGDWTLTISVTPSADATADELASRHFFGWGLAVQSHSINQPAGQFLKPGKLQKEDLVYAFCPPNSIPAEAGINTINSCPCAGGYESTTPYQCKACEVATYRQLSTQSQANFQQRQGVAACVACNSVPAIPIKAANKPEQCSSGEPKRCFPGYETPNGDGACTPCPIGTFSFNPTNNEKCYQCVDVVGAGSTTLSTGSISTVFDNADVTGNILRTDVCTCDVGYFVNSKFPSPSTQTSDRAPQCLPCPVGTYKPEKGAGECIACGVNADSSAGSSSCVCKNGGRFHNYNSETDPAGIGCAPARRYVRSIPAEAECSQLCDGGEWKLNGQPAVTVTCQDPLGNIYPDSQCEGVNGEYKADFMYTAVCNLNPCVVNGYTPQFSSGVIEATIPFGSALTSTVSISGASSSASIDNRAVTYADGDAKSLSLVRNVDATGALTTDVSHAYTASSNSLSNMAVIVNLQWPVGQRFDRLKLTLSNADRPDLNELVLLDMYDVTGQSKCDNSGVANNDPLPKLKDGSSAERLTALPGFTAGGAGTAQLVFTDNAALPALSCRDGVSSVVLQDGESYIVKPKAASFASFFSALNGADGQWQLNVYGGDKTQGAAPTPEVVAQHKIMSWGIALDVAQCGFDADAVVPVLPTGLFFEESAAVFGRTRDASVHLLRDAALGLVRGPFLSYVPGGLFTAPAASLPAQRVWGYGAQCKAAGENVYLLLDPSRYAQPAAPVNANGIVVVSNTNSAPCPYGAVPVISTADLTYECKLCADPDFIAPSASTDSVTYAQTVYYNEFRTADNNGQGQLSASSQIYAANARPGLSVDGVNFARVVTTPARPIEDFTLWGQQGTLGSSSSLVANSASTLATLTRSSGRLNGAIYTPPSFEGNGWGNARSAGVAVASPFSQQTQQGKLACRGCGSDNFAKDLVASGQGCFSGPDHVPCAPGYKENPDYTSSKYPFNFGSPLPCVPCKDGLFAALNSADESAVFPWGYSEPKSIDAVDEDWKQADSRATWHSISKPLNSATCGAVCNKGQTSPSLQSELDWGSQFGAQSSYECVCPAGTFALGGAHEAYLKDGNCVSCGDGVTPSQTFEYQKELFQGDSVNRQVVFGGSRYQGCPNQCPPNSHALPPYTMCSCLPGYESYDRIESNPALFTCTPVRQFVNPVYGFNGVAGACSVPCGSTGFQVLMDVECQDEHGVKYPKESCLVNNQMPASNRACGQQACVANGYTPIFASDVMDTTIPVVQIDVSGQSIPSTAATSTITIPETVTGTVGDELNRLLTVSFTGQFAADLWALRITLTHAGVSVPLFSIPDNSAGDSVQRQLPADYKAGPNPLSTGSCHDALIEAYAQINFNDAAGLPSILCSTAETPRFLSGEAYIVRPSIGSLLAAFNDLPVAGEWTLSVWAQAPVGTINRNMDKKFIQWGLTFDTTVCPSNHFLPTTALNAVQCAACPNNAYGIQSGVNGINSCPCMAGFDGLVPSQCTVCPVNTFRGPITSFYVAQPEPEVSPSFQLRQGVATCQPCHSSTASTGSVSISQCQTDCDAGYFLSVEHTDENTGALVPQQCSACPIGSFKAMVGGGAGFECQPCALGFYQDLTGQTACKACAEHATTFELGAVSCSCQAGFSAAQDSLSGAFCTPIPTWKQDVPWSTCSSPCEGGVRTRPLICQDNDGNVYSNTKCAGQQAPSTSEPCNLDIQCTPNAFIPQFPSGRIAEPDNQILVDSAHAFTVTVDSTEKGVITVSTPVVVHLELQYVKYLQTLRIELTHSEYDSMGSSSSVVLFQLDSSIPCLGSFGSLGKSTSVTFSDHSALPALKCNNADLLNFLPGQSYVVPPSEALSRFVGQPLSGKWTLTLTATNNQVRYAPPVASRYAASRYITSWGLSYAPRTCAPSHFLSTLSSAPRVFGDVECKQCPLNSLFPVKGFDGLPSNGLYSTVLNTINSCPCPGGYSSEVPEKCTICPANTYRALSPFTNPAFQQEQGVSSCLACHSSSDPGTFNAVQCGADCDAGFMFNAAFGCVACPLGFFKDQKGTGACSACPAGMTTTSEAANSVSDCVCLPGYGSTDSKQPKQCAICPAGSFKASSGFGECSLCAKNSVNTPGSSSCECAAGYADYSASGAVDGSGCSFARSWKVNEWGECTATCERAVQRRSVVCTDITGAEFQSGCDAASKPESERLCPTQFSCVRNGFLSNHAEWSQGLNVLMTPSSTDANAVAPATNSEFDMQAEVFKSTDMCALSASGCASKPLEITAFPEELYEPNQKEQTELSVIINMAGSPGATFAAYLVKESLDGKADPIKIPLLNFLVEAGERAVFFDATLSEPTSLKCPLAVPTLDSQAPGQFGAGAQYLDGAATPAVQFVVSDFGSAGSAYPSKNIGCKSGANYLESNTYAAGEVYSLSPDNCVANDQFNQDGCIRAKFQKSGVSAEMRSTTGVYKLYFYPRGGDIQLFSWAIATKQTKCPAGQYVIPPALDGVCVAAPANSRSPSANEFQGRVFQTISNYPCIAGFQSSKPFECSACADASYDLSSFDYFRYPRAQGVAHCASCNALPTGGLPGSFTDPSKCGKQCAAGYYFAGFNGRRPASQLTTNTLPGYPFSVQNVWDNIANDNFGMCEACPVGTYKSESGPGTQVDGFYTCTQCTSNLPGTVPAFTEPATGATSVSSCFCPAGFSSSAASSQEQLHCYACPAGTYQPNPSTGNTPCLPCSVHAESSGSPSGTPACKCAPGHDDYTLGTADYQPDGRNCRPALKWVPAQQQEQTCSSPCDGGIRFTPVACMDSDNNIHLDSECEEIAASNTTAATKPGPRPFPTVKCNMQSCVSAGFTPQFSSGVVNLPLEFSRLDKSVAQEHPYISQQPAVSVIRSTINVDLNTLPPVSSDSLAVHVKLSYPGPVQSVQISLMHFGMPVVLFSQTPNQQCQGSSKFGSNFAIQVDEQGNEVRPSPLPVGTNDVNVISARTTELVFSDVANIPFPACQIDKQTGAVFRPEFYAGESYTIQPYASLAALRGLPAGGDWTLNVAITPSSDASQIDGAVLVSWGLTFAPTVCPVNQFVSAGGFLTSMQPPIRPDLIPAGEILRSGACTPCPSGSVSANQWQLVGIASLNSCLCEAGADMLVDGNNVLKCAKCPAGTFKQLVTPFARTDAQSQPQCLSCNTCTGLACASVANYIADREGATSPSTNINGCGNVCAPGFFTELNESANMGCQPVKKGFYSKGDVANDVTGRSCNAEFAFTTTYLTETPASSAARCVCQPGAFCAAGASAPCAAGCAVCPAGSFAPLPEQSKLATENPTRCLTCAAGARALTEAGSTECKCDAGTVDVVRMALAAGAEIPELSSDDILSGKYCLPEPEWTLTSSSVCSAQCDGGWSTREFQCRDSLGNAYCADGKCQATSGGQVFNIDGELACGVAPAKKAVCNVVPCVDGLYVPQFPSGRLAENGLEIPTVIVPTTDASFQSKILTTTITIPSSETAVLDASNELAFMFTGSFSGSVRDLSIRLRKGDAVWVSFVGASRNSRCDMPMEKWSQIIFSDRTRNTAVCTFDGAFSASNSYSVRALHPLIYNQDLETEVGPFVGLSIAGEWTLEMWSSVPCTASTCDRRILSWGLTVQPTVCHRGTYMQLPFTKGECVSCPVNSYAPSTDGVFTYNNCPCDLGFHAPTRPTFTNGVPDSPFTCSACAANTYLDYYSTFHVPSPQQCGYGVTGHCQSCGSGSTSSSATGLRSGCSTTCAAGATANPQGGCDLCAAGSFKSSTGPDACTVCSGDHTTTAAEGAIDASSCVCAPGYYKADGVCVACAAGLFKAEAGDANTCIACDTDKSTSLAGASTCTCKAGFTDYNELPAPNNCQPNRSWLSRTGACLPRLTVPDTLDRPVVVGSSATVNQQPNQQCDTGVQSQSFECLPNPSLSCASMAHGDEWTSCSTEFSSCVGAEIKSLFTNQFTQISNQYVPQYGSGYLNAKIAMPKTLEETTTQSFTIEAPFTNIQNPTGNKFDMFNSAFTLAVHVSLDIPINVETVTLSLTHCDTYCQTVTLMSFDPAVTCLGQISIAQLVFSDVANLPTLTCAGTNMLFAQPGETYVVKPFQSLMSAFAGMQVGGEYQLTVTMLRPAHVVHPASYDAARRLISWGLTFGPKVCAANQFLLGGSFEHPADLLSGNCVACPADGASFDVAAGLNTVNSCPLKSGFAPADPALNNGKMYKRCPENSFRQLPNTVQPQWMQRNTYESARYGCLACHSTSDVYTEGFAMATMCGNNCDVGYEPFVQALPYTLDYKTQVELPGFVQANEFNSALSAEFSTNLPLTTSTCRACGHNSFKDVTGPSQCISCAARIPNTVGSKIISAASVSYTSCVCAPGFYNKEVNVALKAQYGYDEAPTCVQCPVGTFKSVQSVFAALETDVVCKSCPAQSSNPYTEVNVDGQTTRVYDTSRCVCDAGYVDISAAKDASQCVPDVWWQAGEFSVCSAPCNGGVKTRTVECLNVGGVVANSMCVQAGLTKPAEMVQCNAQPCIKIGYKPQYETQFQNQPIPTVGAFASNGLNNAAYAGWESVTPNSNPITIQGTTAVVTPKTVPVVHMTAEFPSDLQSLRVTLFHAGVSVTLFEMDQNVNCTRGGFAKAGAQVVFSDQAGLLPLQCTDDNQIVFQSGQSYIIRPTTPDFYGNEFTHQFASQPAAFKRGLSAFTGLPVAGEWILTVFAVPTQFEDTTGTIDAQGDLRKLITWGLSFGSSVCGENRYIPYDSVQDECQLCPANSLPVFGGANSPNSCPCASGFYADYRNGYQCSPCDIGSFRSVLMTDSAPFNNMIGPESCTVCNGFTPELGASSAALCGKATTATGVAAGYCYDGYGYVEGGVCQKCAAGTANPGPLDKAPTPDVDGSAQLACPTCPANTFSAGEGNTRCTPCAVDSNGVVIATSVAGSDKCVCVDGLFDYGETSFDPSGSGCRPRRRFVALNEESQCSARCEGGVIRRDVICQDANLHQFDVASCLMSEPPMPVLSPCNVKSCTDFGYIPTFASGSFDMPIPVAQNQLRSAVSASNVYVPNIKAAASANNVISNTLYIVPNFNQTTPLVSSLNQLAVHLTASYVGFLNTLEVTLSHAGVNVTLFDVKGVAAPGSTVSAAAAASSSCEGGIHTAGWPVDGSAPGGDFGAQLIFADQSSEENQAAPFCGTEKQPFDLFASNVYVIKPRQALSAFWGLPSTGPWILTVKSSADPAAIPAAMLGSRVFVSWGLTFEPTVCSANQFVATKRLNSGVCQACAVSTKGWAAPGVNPTCSCPAGMQAKMSTYNDNNDAVVCEACPAGTYKAHVGLDKCVPCAANASPDEHGDACVCNTGFADFGAVPTVSGAACQKKREWVVSAWSQCSTACETGKQTRSVVCQEIDNGAVLPDSACATVGTKPIVEQQCNTQPCLAHSYLAEFQSGGLFAAIPQLSSSSPAFTNSITVNEHSTIGANNQVSVLFSASYFLYLQTLRVDVTHCQSPSDCVTVKLFDLGDNLCYGSFESADKYDAATPSPLVGSQLVFTDQSSLPALSCSNDNLLTFRAGESYAQLPAESLDKLFGRSTTGVWTLSVWSENNPFPEPESSVTSRRVISWGVSFKPSVCKANHYIQGTSFAEQRFAQLSDACVACPTHSLPALAGVNTINNCPCAAGTDSSDEYKCSTCISGKFRSISALSPITYQQRQGVAQCTACNSAATEAGLKSISECGSKCVAGYTYTPGSGCTACPIGSFKAQEFTADACVKCPAGMTTSARGASACECAAGFEADSQGKCVECAAGTFKATISNTDKCIPCASDVSVSSAGAIKCSCATGFDSYAAEFAVDGSSCSPLRFFQYSDKAFECPVAKLVDFKDGQVKLPCGHVTFHRESKCIDNTFATSGSVFDDSDCLRHATKPSTSFACEYANCIDYANPSVLHSDYQAEFGAGGFGVSEPAVFTADNFEATNPVGSIPVAPAVLSHTITIKPEDANVGDAVVSVANSVAVHFTALYTNSLQTLQVTLSHAGQTVYLFRLNDAECEGSLGADVPRTSSNNQPALSSVIFNDFASVQTPTCDIDNTLHFQAGLAHIIQPAQALSNFYGLPVAGDWTINVWSRNDMTGVTLPAAADRVVRNWGLTFGPTLCDDGEFLKPSTLSFDFKSSLKSGLQCVPCYTSEGYSASEAGVNSVASCGCKAGYQMLANSNSGGLQYVVPECMPCKLGSYKSTFGFGVCMPCSQTSSPSGRDMYATSSSTVNDGATKCACNQGYEDYTFADTGIEAPPSGRGCKPKRVWATGPWNECSNACDTGVQMRVVQCIDPAYGFGVSPAYDEANCADQVKPTDIRPCNSHSCAGKHTYNSEFGSGYLGAAGELSVGSPVSNSFTVPLSYLETGAENPMLGVSPSTFAVTVNLADVPFGGDYGLHMTLTLNDAFSYTLFSVPEGSQCEGSFRGTGAALPVDSSNVVGVEGDAAFDASQIVFTDATADTVLGACQPGRQLTFQAQMPYAYRIHGGASGNANDFGTVGGLRLYGTTFTLSARLTRSSSVAANAGVEIDGELVQPRIVSFGVAHQVTKCGGVSPGLYVAPPALNGACVSCGAHTLPTSAASSFNAITDCECESGYDYTSENIVQVPGAYKCVACPSTSANGAYFRDTSASLSVAHHQLNFQNPGVSQCSVCNSRQATVSPATSVSECGDQCKAGYEPLADGGCKQCAVGSFKATPTGYSSAACSACPAGTTLSTGASSMDDCVCVAGETNEKIVNGIAQCEKCPVNTFTSQTSLVSGPRMVASPCLACAQFAFAAIGSSACSCRAGWAVPSTVVAPKPDGSDCAPVATNPALASFILAQGTLSQVSVEGVKAAVQAPSFSPLVNEYDLSLTFEQIQSPISFCATMLGSNTVVTQRCAGFACTNDKVDLSDKCANALVLPTVATGRSVQSYTWTITSTNAGHFVEYVVRITVQPSTESRLSALMLQTADGRIPYFGADVSPLVAQMPEQLSPAQCGSVCAAGFRADIDEYVLVVPFRASALSFGAIPMDSTTSAAERISFRYGEESEWTAVNDPEKGVINAVGTIELDKVPIGTSVLQVKAQAPSLAEKVYTVTITRQGHLDPVSVDLLLNFEYSEFDQTLFVQQFVDEISAYVNVSPDLIVVDEFVPVKANGRSAGLISFTILTNGAAEEAIEPHEVAIRLSSKIAESIQEPSANDDVLFGSLFFVHVNKDQRTKVYINTMDSFNGQGLQIRLGGLQPALDQNSFALSKDIVYGAAYPPSDARVSSMTLKSFDGSVASVVVFDRAVRGDVQLYKASIPASVNGLSLSVSTADSGATVEVAFGASGSLSQYFPLSSLTNGMFPATGNVHTPSGVFPFVGVNEIRVRVTARDGVTPLYYLLEVEQQSNLAALQAAYFDASRTKNYVDINEFSFTSASGVVPCVFETSDPAARIVVSIAAQGLEKVVKSGESSDLVFGFGATDVLVLVQSADKTRSNSYTFTVTRKDSDSTLKSLVPSLLSASSATELKLDTVFSPSVKKYTVTINSVGSVGAVSASTITLISTANSDQARLGWYAGARDAQYNEKTVPYTSMVSGSTQSFTIAAAAGSTRISVRVTAGDGSVSYYQLTVVRLSNDYRLTQVNLFTVQDNEHIYVPAATSFYSFNKPTAGATITLTSAQSALINSQSVLFVQPVSVVAGSMNWVRQLPGSALAQFTFVPTGELFPVTLPAASQRGGATAIEVKTMAPDGSTSTVTFKIVQDSSVNLLQQLAVGPYATNEAFTLDNQLAEYTVNVPIPTETTVVFEKVVPQFQYESMSIPSYSVQVFYADGHSDAPQMTVAGIGYDFQRSPMQIAIDVTVQRVVLKFAVRGASAESTARNYVITFFKTQ